MPQKLNKWFDYLENELSDTFDRLLSEVGNKEAEAMRNHKEAPCGIGK